MDAIGSDMSSIYYSDSIFSLAKLRRKNESKQCFAIFFYSDKVKILLYELSLGKRPKVKIYYQVCKFRNSVN